MLHQEFARRPAEASRSQIDPPMPRNWLALGLTLDSAKCGSTPRPSRCSASAWPSARRRSPTSGRRSTRKSLLGGALLGQKKYADAEPLLLTGYEGMKQREKTIPPQGQTRLPEALDRLIELYTATNKPDEVKKRNVVHQLCDDRGAFDDLSRPEHVLLFNGDTIDLSPAA